MKKFLMSVVLMLLSLTGCKYSESRPDNFKPNKNLKNFHDFSVKDIEGNNINLDKFKGKKILVVNVASECGYTPQYEDLQKLYDSYNDKLIVLGFPANNFGEQEPGTNEQIKEFCSKNYGVTFPMFQKISVKGDDMHPLFKWLSNKEENGWNDKAPTWNFCKYLIDENGNLIKFFNTGVKPLSEEITGSI